MKMVEALTRSVKDVAMKCVYLPGAVAGMREERQRISKKIDIAMQELT